MILPPLLRRTLVCACIGLLLLTVTSPASPAPALKKVRLQLDWYPDAERGGYVAAVANGYYAEAGLDVELLPANPGMSSMVTLLTGAIDFALSTSDQVMIVRNQSLPGVCVMATMQHDPLVVMVHAESPVHDFKDLEGKSIATTPGTSWLIYVKQKYQLKSLRETRLTYGVSNFLINPNYIQQAFLTSEPYICEQHHVKVRTLLVRDTGCDPYRVVMASEKLIARDPAMVQAFVTASIKGWKKYLADPASTDEEIKKRNPQMTQDWINYSRQTLIDGHFVDGMADKKEAVGKLDLARLQAQAKILSDLHILADNFDASKSFAPQFTQGL